MTLAIWLTDSPKSLAKTRSICTPKVGLGALSELSKSTMPLTCAISAIKRSEIFCNSAKSGPLMEIITGFCPPDTVSSAEAIEVTVMPPTCCRRWRNSLFKSVKLFLRSVRGVTVTRILTWFLPRSVTPLITA